MRGKIEPLIGDIVEVKWRDSNQEITQCSSDSEFLVAEIMTIGQLIQKHEDRIVIARDIIGNDVRGVISIPRENIISFD